MSVRRRTWQNHDGSQGTAWIVDYVDQAGHRHTKNFERKRDADAYHATVAVNVRAGVHTAESRSITVTEAGELWLKASASLERTTLESYEQQLRLHIVPMIGKVKLAQLNVPMVKKFEDNLAEAGRSHVMVRNVRRSLGAILAEAQERGLVAQNVVRSLRRGRAAARQRAKLKVGVDIPSPDEIRALVARLDDRRRPLLLTRDLHRAALVRATGATVDGHRPQARRPARAPARRSLSGDWTAQVGRRRAHGPAAAAPGEHLAGMEARLSQGRARSRLPECPWRI
jgi:hypothetical protein